MISVFSSISFADFNYWHPQCLATAILSLVLSARRGHSTPVPLFCSLPLPHSLHLFRNSAISAFVPTTLNVKFECGRGHHIQIKYRD